MTIKAASITLITPSLKETRKFYEELFQASAIFDCGWYVVLRLSNEDNGPELCLMQPQNDATTFSGGITINLKFDNVDHIHTSITQAGLVPVIPLEDHPWGDRGFGITDPAGATVYCYHPIEPSTEFERYFIDR